MNLFRKNIGQEGEDRAARYLAKLGYRIPERNYRTPAGEIDLIALHRGTVVFVEVKTRTSDVYGAPELAFTPQKQQRIIKAALGYIRQRKFHQVLCRFDVVAISAATEKEVELIQNAFEMARTRY